ncbi:MAG TPA: carboxypeptidase-like regulatory domain-containing protein [Planctomycetota bacterium]|nr:carboxypeptidase-like regulatory domain-containing protein [Planctomycetota bacterium]
MKVADTIVSSHEASLTQAPETDFVPDASSAGREQLIVDSGIHFLCRIVQDETGMPLSSARVQFVSRNEHCETLEHGTLAVDARGELEVDQPIGMDCALLVDAIGFERAFVPIVAGHETDRQAVEVRLGRQSSLVVRVTGLRRKTDSALTVRATVPEYAEWQADFWLDEAHRSRSRFETRIDEQGLARLDGLPARIGLELSVLDGLVPLLVAAAHESLEPGEEREVRLSIGTRPRLRGVVRDQFGAPFAESELWLVRFESDVDTAFGPHTKPFASSWTGIDGRFEVVDLRAGEWLIGPREQRHAASDGQICAAVGQRVVVPKGDACAEVELQVWRGIYLRGFVRLSSGEPATGCNVFAQPVSAGARETYATTSNDAGEFELGPVRGVEYELTAGGKVDGDYSRSPAVVAKPGREEIVLVVDRAARLHGTVIDSDTGERRSAAVFVVQSGVREGFGAGCGVEGGAEFEFSGLKSGEWDVSAETLPEYDPLVLKKPRPLVAAARVTLVAGETREMTLRVSPSARLTVTNASSALILLQPESNGILLRDTAVQPGEGALLDVPPGPITLLIQDEHGVTLAERKIDAAPGSKTAIRYP